MPDLADLAYPPALRDAEREILAQRPNAARRDPLVGIGVSGGGIRSATFALGVFQSIAHLRLLERVDYISTVSGGGYFGAFLGRLFARSYVKSTADVESILRGTEAAVAADAPRSDEEAACLNQARWKVIGWLRENGRYLSPRGSGDLLFGGAVLLRNWASVQVVLALFFFALFLILQVPRVLVRAGVGGTTVAAVVGWWRHFATRGDVLLWSPWLTPAVLAFAVAVPLGWAYWLVTGGTTLRSVVRAAVRRASAWWSVVAVWGLWALAQGVWTGTADRERAIALAIAQALAVTATAAVVCVLMATATRGRPRTAAAASDGLFAGQHQRHVLSVWLLHALITGAIFAVLGGIDSLAQTTYHTAYVHDLSLKRWWSFITAAFAIWSGLARQVTILAGPKSDGRRPRIPVSLLAAAVAMLIAGSLLIGLDVFSHAVAWQFGAPGQNPAIVPVYAAWAAGMTALAYAGGRGFAFLNQSSHQPLYSARLIRAYLGASNPARWDRRAGMLVPVIDPIAGDDIEIHEYWPPPGTPPARDGMYAKGMPLHLVNVTVNETIDGQSQVEQQDRKGIGMALGPAGLSVGIRHHALVRSRRSADAAAGTHVIVAGVFPRDDYRAFNYDAPLADADALMDFPGEPLSLGRWIGISGAAFSTGTGYRTSLGLSLLAGLGNVRLGYWWDSAISEKRTGAPAVLPRRSAALWRWLTARFPVQGYLLSEFVARFPGTSRRFWYLSDGGHFENMGGYELVRRRLPVIVILDAEADPEYTFEGLSNLVRKARLDFQTEIVFLDADDLTAAKLRFPIGPLDALRPAGERSRARAALARVLYSTGEQGWLLYVKPVLCGGEPADVVQYARANRPFPQQTTADQFFDEAQWESYRKLGEHISEHVLTPLGAMLAEPASPGELEPLRRFLAGA